MGKLIDMLFGLVAYVCVATVITLALILGYLWHSDQLNNGKLFRLMAVMQDVGKVVSQLEQVSPDVGKDQLMRWIDETKMDDAIRLMSKMSETKLAKILKTFSTPEELTKLHEIHVRIINSGTDSSKLEKAL